MAAYSKSGSSASAAKIRSNSPLSAQRRKRFHTEPHLPNASGKSRHGVPARTIHSTASRNRRLSAAERPGSPSLAGSRGAIPSQCASVRSNRIVILRRRPREQRSRPRSAYGARRHLPVDLDQVDEAVDAVIGEGHDAVVAEAQDPDQAVLGLHFDGDVEQEVDVLAEVFGDAVDGPD